MMSGSESAALNAMRMVDSFAHRSEKLYGLLAEMTARLQEMRAERVLLSERLESKGGEACPDSRSSSSASSLGKATDEALSAIGSDLGSYIRELALKGVTVDGTFSVTFDDRDVFFEVLDGFKEPHEDLGVLSDRVVKVHGDEGHQHPLTLFLVAPLDGGDQSVLKGRELFLRVRGREVFHSSSSSVGGAPVRATGAGSSTPDPTEGDPSADADRRA